MTPSVGFSAESCSEHRREDIGTLSQSGIGLILNKFQH